MELSGSPLGVGSLDDRPPPTMPLHGRRSSRDERDRDAGGSQILARAAILNVHVLSSGLTTREESAAGAVHLRGMGVIRTGDKCQRAFAGQTPSSGGIDATSLEAASCLGAHVVDFPTTAKQVMPDEVRFSGSTYAGAQDNVDRVESDRGNDSS